MVALCSSDVSLKFPVDGYDHADFDIAAVLPEFVLVLLNLAAICLVCHFRRRDYLLLIAFYKVKMCFKPVQRHER